MELEFDPATITGTAEKKAYSTEIENTHQAEKTEVGQMPIAYRTRQ